MKHLFKIGLAALVALALITNISLAGPDGGTILPRNAFNVSASGTANGPNSTNSWTVVGGSSINGGAPMVTYVDATSDKSNSVIQTYQVGYIQTANLTNSGTEIYTDAVPAALMGAGIVLIRHLPADTYERLAVVACATGTNYTTTVAPATTVVPGDKVYWMKASSYIPLGAANKAVNGPGIFAGQRDLPMLIEVDGTSACSINTVTARYER